MAQQRPPSWLSRCLFGAGAGLQGLSLLFRSPRRLLLCLLPASIGLLLLLVGAAAGLARLPRLWHFCVAYIGGGEAGPVLAVLATLAAAVMVAAGGLVLMLAVVVIVSAPLGSRLSAEAEAECGGPPAPVWTLGQEVAEALRGIAHSLLRLGIYVAVTAVLLLLPLLLPPLLLVTAPVALLSTCAFIAYNLLDPPLSRRRLSFSEKWRFLSRHAPECLGLALVALPLWTVPVLNLFMAPALSLGGGVLCARLWPGPGPRSS